jgi:1,4-alpha-glucan branching enzyme
MCQLAAGRYAAACAEPRPGERWFQDKEQRPMSAKETLQSGKHGDRPAAAKGSIDTPVRRTVAAQPAGERPAEVLSGDLAERPAPPAPATKPTQPVVASQGEAASSAKRSYPPSASGTSATQEKTAAAEQAKPQPPQPKEAQQSPSPAAPASAKPLPLQGASVTKPTSSSRPEPEQAPVSQKKAEPANGRTGSTADDVATKKAGAAEARTPATPAKDAAPPATPAKDTAPPATPAIDAATSAAPAKDAGGTPAAPAETSAAARPTVASPLPQAAKAAPAVVPPAPSGARPIPVAVEKGPATAEAIAQKPSPTSFSPGLADSAAPALRRPISPELPAKRRKPGPAQVDYHRLAPDGDVNAVLYADHRDPFAFLGMHALGPEGPLVVRAFLPSATSVTVLDAASGEPVTTLERIRDAGFFAGGISAGEWFAYRLQITTDDGTFDIDDPYRFPPVLSDADVHLLAEGSHLKSYEKLGAHLTSMQGVAGVAFTVWAPHAGRVAVIGDFNDWDGRRHGMRLRHECGVWEIFLPGVEAGRLYKFEIKSSNGTKLTDKSDPCAFQVEKAPASASIVCDLDRYNWRDAGWMERRQSFDARRSPISIYELHLGSWRRRPEEGHRCLTYQEHADELIGYLKDMGFTHVQLMPVSEFDSDASVGYQPFALYAPTSRWGTPEQFRLLVDRCHQAGIGVIADWAPNQFSDDPHGLANFDGTPLYEHPDPRQRRHPGSNTLTYDYGRREVANFLTANALFWLDKYHLDALRVPAVETMLYLDYARARGEWAPNRFGGHENLEAIDLLRHLNERVYARFPGTFTVAEENSAWQRVSHPTFVGGLGFGFRWNTGWVRQTLRYFSRNPVHRKYYHDELLQGPAAAFSENYVLPLSHAEVSIGKGSLLRKMPGDRWQRFANLRAYYSLMYTHPGKKLLFMGDEFAQEREWNSEISLDWHLLGDSLHRGVQSLVRDLNALYWSTPALYELDCDPEGFSWIDCNNSDQSVISFLRQTKDGKGVVAVVCNLTPVVRPQYRIGVPEGGFYQERLNSDSEAYGGANVGSEGGVDAIAEPMHGRPFSLALKLPPFAVVVLEHKGRRRAQ